MLITRALFLLVVLLPINSLANGQSQPPISISTQKNNENPSESPNEQSYKDKYSSESLKTTLKEIVSQYQNQETQSRGNQEHYWYDTFLDNATNWFLAIFSGFLVLFTWRLWVSTHGLWQESIKQGKDNLRAIEATERSANAAKESADALTASERAHLFVKIILNTSDHDPDQPPINIGTDELPGANKIDIVITNHGKTPAILTKVNSVTKVYDASGGNMPKNSEIKGMTFIPGTIIIDAGREIEKPFNDYFFMDSGKMKNITHHNFKLICIGLVAYEDIFGQNHETGFIWQYNDLFKKFVAIHDTKRNYRT